MSTDHLKLLKTGSSENDNEEFVNSDLQDAEFENKELEIKQMQCPYCWELFEWVFDESDESDEMIEDCPVCCRAIHFKKLTTQGINEPSQWEAMSEEDFYE